MLFETIVNREARLKHDPFKSEVFSLGMVVLECGLRASVQEVYNLKSKKFEEKVLDSLILSFEDVYPNQHLLWSVLRGCLRVSEKERSTPEKVL